jgi:hypothetical protein
MKNNKWTNSSEIGEASSCEKKIYYKSLGKKQREGNITAMKNGTKLHNQASKHHKSSACYIATCVYGVDHEITILLRDYRDTKLSKSMLGKVAIKMYYSTSPILVRILGKLAIFRYICKKLISLFILVVVRRK